MDVIAFAASQAALRTELAVPAAFSVGVITCFGPCVAPRLIAAISLAGGTVGAARWQRSVLFALGVGCCSIATGVVTAALMRLASWSPLIYVGLAIAFSYFGVKTILAPQHVHCDAGDGNRTNVSAGAIFLLGCSFGLVASPCCTPIIAALAALASALSGDFWFGVAVVGAFVIGHTLPLLSAGLGAGSIDRLVTRHGLGMPVAVVSGALMVALAGYYALLA